MEQPMRCRWARREPETTYHDEEWGTPQHDDRALFELLSLEGAQAGLSWTTILKKRDGYRAVFANFDPDIVAAFDAERIEALVVDPRIVRNRSKIRSTVANAAAFLEIRRAFGTFDAYLWGFVGGVPVVTRWVDPDDVPARTDLSDRVSADLRKRGFGFVGSTIVYAFLQATGVVDDHLASCFKASATFAAPAT